MPPLHKYLGNPVLTASAASSSASRCAISTADCARFAETSIRSLNLRTTGMEFACEMVVKSTLAGLRMTEVPTTLSPDGRSRPPHLRSWRDGWRHLRFLLLYSPRWLFFYPGLRCVVGRSCSGGAAARGPLPWAASPSTWTR